jgi:hypothetical protein
MSEMAQARRALDDLGRTVVSVYDWPDPTSFTGQPRVAHKRLDELVPQLFTLAEKLLVMVENGQEPSMNLLGIVSTQRVRDLIEEALT